MSLGIVVYDIIDNEALNENGVPFAVLSDDNINTIKEKIFSLIEDDNIKYYPNFVKLLDKNVCKDKMNIYIKSILDEFDDENIVELYFNLNGDTFNELYESFKKEYEEITEDDLIFIIKYKLKTDDMIDQIRLIEPSIDQYILEYIDMINKRKEEIQKYYVDTQKALQDFYKLLYTASDFSSIENIKYTGIVLSFGNVDARKFIKLSQIFNTFELSKDIPFIALANKEGDPIIKVYNEILNTMSDKEIKSWIINEKKKVSQTSYKKIKGLMIKHKMDSTFLTITLMENGYINAKINFTEEEVKTLDEIIYVMKVGINYIINYINSLGGIFSKSQKLSLNEYKIESVTAMVETSRLLELDSIKNTLRQVGYDDIFVLKDTKSTDVLSMYYKKMCKVQADDTETKGITVTIRNNPYKLNSSLINIYSALNVSSIERIAKMLILINQLKKTKKIVGIFAKKIQKKKEEEDVEQKVISKANIKLLREQAGVSLSSKKCQKQRQPRIIDGTGDYQLPVLQAPKPSSYILEFKNNKYICPNIEYPYPGFIGDNLPCCFNKPQKHTEKYIRNMHPELNDIIVRPSNFKVTIEKNNTRFETFAIKVVSEYMPMMNETNAFPRYYYISGKKDLIPIINKDLIELLETESVKDIWLNEVSLATLVFEPPKNKCNNTPNMDNKNDMNLNAPCEHHEKNRIFGYNQNSFPCCFANPVDTYIKHIKKTGDETKVKDYILQQDKILNPDKIGILPPNIDNIFNNIIKQSENKFYKRGVLTGQSQHSSFINAILYGSNFKIKNASDFIKYIVEYLNTNPDDFQKLHSGDISKKYKTLENFIKNLRNISWYDLLDITQRIVQHNIIIIDVPYVSNKLELDYDKVKLYCSYNVKMDNKNPFIILIKKKNIFENVVQLNDKKMIVAYNFRYDSNSKTNENIVNFLLDFYDASCVKEDIFPENFKYDKLYTNDELYNILKNTPVEIKLQLLNDFNKVNMIVTQNNIVLPIKQNGIKDSIPWIRLDEYVYVTLEEYIRGIELINRYLNKPIKILGVTIDDKNNYTSVQTSFGILVPLKPSRRDDMLFNYPILKFKYYNDADKNHSLNEVDKTIEQKLSIIIFKEDMVLRYIKQIIGDKDLSKDDKINKIVELFRKIQQRFYENDNFKDDKLELIANKYIINLGVIYNDFIKEMKGEIYNIKYKLGSIISTNEKLIDQIKSINKKMDIVRNDKIDSITKIFIKLMPNTDIFILKHIANEVINDNIENSLLNNMVVPDEFNPNEIIQKDTESVLLNIEDIKNWIKKYKQDVEEDVFVDFEDDNI